MANLRFRKKLYGACASNRDTRRAVIKACREDTLFFYNAFLWVFEPRPGMPYGEGKLPFITWPLQDRSLKVVDRYWGLEDIRFLKSRGEGATWLVCCRVLYDWVFDDPWNPGTFGLVTRSEETVDSTDDPDSLMWKMDWEVSQLPKWLVHPDQVKRKITDHSLKNERNGSTIVGYAASEDVGSGGRKRVFVMDELAKFSGVRKGADEEAMASTQPVSNCRVIISTPKGVANAYYDAIVEDTDLDRVRITRRLFTDDDHREFADRALVVMHWTDNPNRNRGLYRVNEYGEINIVDEVRFGRLPDEYYRDWPSIRLELERRGFNVLGTYRSPWYDHECLRVKATPQKVAQEYDLNFGGSDYTIFDDSTMAAARETCRHPLSTWEVIPHGKFGNPELLRAKNGRLQLWIHVQPDTHGPPRGGSYTIGVDVASGLGGSSHSNSVASIVDMDTGEQVGEWASNAVPVSDFCDICIALGTIFNNALIIHESNGPFGKAFTAQLLRRGYDNVYMRRDPYKRHSRASESIGWASGTDTKPAMLEDLARKLRMRMVAIRSRQLAEELRSWVMVNGRVVHSKAVTTTDESSRNEAHGDRVIAFGLATMRYDYNPHEDPEVRPEERRQERAPNPMTMAYRLMKYDLEQSKRRSLDW